MKLEGIRAILGGHVAGSVVDSCSWYRQWHCHLQPRKIQFCPVFLLTTPTPVLWFLFFEIHETSKRNHHQRQNDAAPGVNCCSFLPFSHLIDNFFVSGALWQRLLASWQLWCSVLSHWLQTLLAANHLWAFTLYFKELCTINAHLSTRRDANLVIQKMTWSLFWAFSLMGWVLNFFFGFSIKPGPNDHYRFRSTKAKMFLLCFTLVLICIIVLCDILWSHPPIFSFV